MLLAGASAHAAVRSNEFTTNQVPGSIETVSNITSGVLSLDLNTGLVRAKFEASSGDPTLQLRNGGGVTATYGVNATTATFATSASGGFASTSKWSISSAGGSPGLRISGTGGGDTGFEVVNQDGNNANSFFFNTASDYIGIGIGETTSYVQSSLPFEISPSTSFASTVTFNSSVNIIDLTPSTVVMADGSKNLTVVSASGSEIVLGDGSPATFTVINSLASGTIVTNGMSIQIAFSNRLNMASNIVFLTTSNGIVGDTTGNNALAGVVGEHTNLLKAAASSQAMQTGNATNVLAVTLAAGDWDVEGNVNFSGTGATNLCASINTTANTMVVDGSEAYALTSGAATGSITNGVCLARKRIAVSGSTTVYLIGKATFGGGAVATFGAMSARRAR